MNKDKFDRYAELKRIVTEAERELGELKGTIIEMMGDNDEVQTDSGTFIIQKRRTWTYPVELQKQAEKLKADQQEAQRLGNATYVEQPVLIFHQ